MGSGRRWLMAGLIAAVAGLEAPALGQETPPAASEPLILGPIDVFGQEERGDGPVQGYRATRSTTATRTDTPLLETPASVTVLPRDLSRDRASRSAAEALVAVPSVYQRQSYQGYEAFTVRGLLLDESNAFQIDGMRTRNLLTFDPALFERVEVLKGLASLLYGSMEPGGVVNFVTAPPPREPFVEGGVQVASYNDVRTTLDAGYSLEGGSGVRLPVVARRYDSFRDEVDDNRYVGLMPSLDAVLGERTRARLVVGYLDQKIVDDTILIPVIDGRPVNIPKRRFLGQPDARQEDRLLQSILSLEHDFSDAVSWRNTVSLLRTSSDQDTVSNFFGVGADGRTLDPFRVEGDANVNAQQFRSELVADATLFGMPHRALVGVDLLRDRNETSNDGEQLVPIDIFAPANDDTVAVPDFVFDNYRQEVLTQSVGAYFQDQVTVLDDLPAVHKLIAVVGGRYDAYKQSTDQGGLLFGAPNEGDSDAKEAQLSPRLGLVWQPITPLSLYGSWSRSFQPQFGGTLATTPPEPQEAEQFEVGIKVEPTPLSQVTLSFFDIKQENVAQTAADGVTTVLVGEERSKGMEIELSGELLPGWQVFGGYSLIDAEVGEATDGTEGNELFGAPRHRATLGTSYSVRAGALEGLGGGAGLFYTGESFADNANDVRLASYRTVDAALWYRPGQGMVGVGRSLEVGVKNLLDEDYFLSGNGFNSVEPGEPRTFYAGLRMAF